MRSPSHYALRAIAVSLHGLLGRKHRPRLPVVEPRSLLARDCTSGKGQVVSFRPFPRLNRCLMGALGWKAGRGQVAVAITLARSMAERKEEMAEFQEFEKIARWSRNIVVTEKIDGTNASIYIGEDGEFKTGSRNRWITPEDDNFGFSRWAHEHRDELLTLGPGRHFGEWWGAGIQRRYGLEEKRFSLFNSGRWFDLDATAGESSAGKTWAPSCCHVVPVLLEGPNDQRAIEGVLNLLRERGSYASPGFMKPEGIVIYHCASRTLYKKTLEKDEMPKSVAERKAA